MSGRSDSKKTRWELLVNGWTWNEEQEGPVQTTRSHLSWSSMMWLQVAAGVAARARDRKETRSRKTAGQKQGSMHDEWSTHKLK